MDFGPEVGDFVVHDLANRKEFHLDEAEGVAVGFGGGDADVFVEHGRVEAVDFAGGDLLLDHLDGGIGVAGGIVRPGDGVAQGVEVDLDDHGRGVRRGFDRDEDLFLAGWQSFNLCFLHGEDYTKFEPWRVGEWERSWRGSWRVGVGSCETPMACKMGSVTTSPSSAQYSRIGVGVGVGS